MTNCKVIVNAVRKGLRPYPDRLYAVDGTDCVINALSAADRVIILTQSYDCCSVF